MFLGRNQHQQRVPERIAAVVPDYGTACPVALVTDPAAGVVVEERRMQPLPARLGQQQRLGSVLALQVHGAVPRQVAYRHVDRPGRRDQGRVVGARLEGVGRNPAVQEDQVTDRLLIRVLAPGRAETGAHQGERHEHAVLDQGLIGLAGDGLGDVAGDGIADVRIREALAAGRLRLVGEDVRDEAAPFGDQLLRGVGPDLLALAREVTRSAGGVGHQVMQRTGAPAAGHLDIGQQRRQRIVRGEQSVVFQQPPAAWRSSTW